MLLSRRSAPCWFWFAELKVVPLYESVWLVSVTGQPPPTTSTPSSTESAWTTCGLGPVTKNTRRDAGSITGVPRIPSPPAGVTCAVHTGSPVVSSNADDVGIRSQRRKREEETVPRRTPRRLATGRRRRTARPRGPVLQVQHRRHSLILRVAVGRKRRVRVERRVGRHRRHCGLDQPRLNVGPSPKQIIASLKHRLRTAHTAAGPGRSRAAVAAAAAAGHAQRGRRRCAAGPGGARCVSAFGVAAVNREQSKPRDQGGEHTQERSLFHEVSPFSVHAPSDRLKGTVHTWPRAPRPPRSPRSSRRRSSGTATRAGCSSCRAG